MQPPFNSFQPQGHHQRPQQQQNNGYSNNHNQRNGYHQNQGNSNQFGMNNPQMMNNPMMGHMNNPIPMPNRPIHLQFYNNMLQQQQAHQFGLANINHLLQCAVANSNLMGHSLPLAQPNFYRPPPLDPCAFTSQPQLNSFNSHSYPNPHQNHQLQPRPLGQSGGIVNNNNNNGSNANGNDFRNNFTNHQKFKGPGQGVQRSQLHQANNAKNKRVFNKKDHMAKGSYNKMATGLDGTDAGNIAEKKSVIQPNGDRRAKNGRFQNNRQNKRKRHGYKDKIKKKPRFKKDENSSQESCVITRKPTLLEKLLSGDIKREKSQLLQVFRFMVMNSFFKEFPEQPLKLPVVMVEETGYEHDWEEDPTNEILIDDDDDDDNDDGDGDGDGDVDLHSDDEVFELKIDF
ncbi:hypothetical protein AALP_AA2G188500 [Arabis alpina]|uniref:FMR1-interacting protein 1 conserved domain-containing protein n=1 Tax=Arabis alpina TaxID=50452 RepID=A0A087HIG1_ARAAL|nr:hypothetical protein AALP_AA2G188500 [Arabis alpina]